MKGAIDLFLFFPWRYLWLYGAHGNGICCCWIPYVKCRCLKWHDGTPIGTYKVMWHFIFFPKKKIIFYILYTKYIVRMIHYQEILISDHLIHMFSSKKLFNSKYSGINQHQLPAKIVLYPKYISIKCLNFKNKDLIQSPVLKKEL